MMENQVNNMIQHGQKIIIVNTSSSSSACSMELSCINCNYFIISWNQTIRLDIIIAISNWLTCTWLLITDSWTCHNKDMDDVSGSSLGYRHHSLRSSQRLPHINLQNTPPLEQIEKDLNKFRICSQIPIFIATSNRTCKGNKNRRSAVQWLA